MIRCYEAILSKNLDYRVIKVLCQEWIDKRNTYGIELKKYIIDNSPEGSTILGLYIEDSKVFGDSILVDKYFSENLIGELIYCFNDKLNKECCIKLCKRRILKFFPINYEEPVFSREIYSGFTKLIGLFKENNKNVIGAVIGNVYQVNEKYKGLFLRIWISNMENKKEKIFCNKTIEI